MTTRALGLMAATFASAAWLGCSDSTAGDDGASGGRSGAASGGGAAGGGGITTSGGTGAGSAGLADTGGGGGSLAAGAAGMSGAAGAAGSASGAAGFAGGGASATCPEQPVPLRNSGVLMELATELTLNGMPVEFGEPNPLADGGSLLPLDFRFYVSKVALLRADETIVDVDIVTEAGAPVPYGVHLVNADDSQSERFRLLVPPGSYSGLAFTLGLEDACNSAFGGGNPPLSAASGMTWPPPFGYLFLRYQGMVTSASSGAVPPDAGSAASLPPSSIHMGGLPGNLLAPRVEAPGELIVGEGALVSARLALNLDEVFEGATAPLDVSDVALPPGDEVVAGERLRRSAPELMLFTLLSP